MKKNRREFLKLAGAAGLGITGASFTGRMPASDAAFSQPRRQRFNMHGYAAPRLDTVRVGIIGIGRRGSGTVRRMAAIDGVEIKALCDLNHGKVSAAIESIAMYPHHRPDSYAGGQDEWKKVCERADIDLIVIVTPWNLHTIMAVYAMEHEKHAYTELPAAQTIEDCWRLVETSEQTRRHCVQVSSSCHNPMQAVILNMARQGFFGEIIHGEGAYIHDLFERLVGGRQPQWEPRHSRLRENMNRNGNLYPQHGLGPVAQMMDLNYGDQMDYMVSMSSIDFMIADKVNELAAEDESLKEFAGQSFRGNMNTSIIRTQRGRTIMLQHDVTSPRPGVRFDLLSGTKGIFSARPSRIATSHDGWLPQQEFDSLVEKYTPALIKRFNELVRQGGSHEGLAGYSRVSSQDWRLIDCLRNGLPVEMDVYDAALWSSIIPLSEWSVANRSNSVQVPDFTAEAWKTNKRGMDIELRNGGGTTALI